LTIDVSSIQMISFVVRHSIYIFKQWRGPKRRGAWKNFSLLSPLDGSAYMRCKNSCFCVF